MNIDVNYETSLFKEIDGTFSREDEWSYPKSIALLGWSSEDQETPECYADRYFKAAEAACELVMSNDVEDYVLTVPILYLYRHSIELYLKACRKKKGKGHQLFSLLQDVPNLPVWLKNWINELHTIDPKSTALRYHDEKLDGFEIGCELNEFQAKMSAIRDYLKDRIRQNKV